MRIHSLLDNDFYKLTMMQAVYHNFAAVTAEYALVCRSHQYAAELAQIAPALKKEISQLSALTLSAAERDYLSGLNCFSPDFIEHLSAFRFEPELVTVTSADGKLILRVSGPWLKTILFEVPLLALINELFYETRFPEIPRTALPPLEELRAADVRFSDFGTRRRISFEHQSRVLAAIKDFPGFTGTSNVLFAMRGNVPPIGTMAHEYLQAGQAIFTPRTGQREMLKLWLTEHNGKFAVALTDVITTEGFLADFDRELAEAYTGLRHDSGNPVDWGRAMLAHYKKLGIDPKTKSLVFSDMITPAKAAAISKAFSGQTKVLFGIGSWLDNNIGLPRLNSVIKMVRCNGKPVAKITNNAEKTTAEDTHYLAALRSAYGLNTP